MNPNPARLQLVLDGGMIAAALAVKTALLCILAHLLSRRRARLSLCRCLFLTLLLDSVYVLCRAGDGYAAVLAASGAMFLLGVLAGRRLFRIGTDTALLLSVIYCTIGVAAADLAALTMDRAMPERESIGAVLCRALDDYTRRKTHNPGLPVSDTVGRAFSGALGYWIAAAAGESFTPVARTPPAPVPPPPPPGPAAAAPAPAVVQPAAVSTAAAAPGAAAPGKGEPEHRAVPDATGAAAASVASAFPEQPPETGPPAVTSPPPQEVNASSLPALPGITAAEEVGPEPALTSGQGGVTSLLTLGEGNVVMAPGLQPAPEPEPWIGSRLRNVPDDMDVKALSAWAAAAEAIAVDGTVLLGKGRGMANIGGEIYRPGEELTVAHGGRTFTFRLVSVTREDGCLWTPVVRETNTPSRRIRFEEVW